MPSNTNQKLFYNEQATILLKYAHLRTPIWILNEIKNLKSPRKKSTSTASGITITYSSSHTDFFEDSLKHAHMDGNPCELQVLMEYWTTFRSLNKQQKKWYLYWRSETLRGNFMDNDLSYIILFTYELLNYSFNSNAAFNASMLERLYENYKDKVPKIGNYLPRWTSDFLLELGEVELAKEWERDFSQTHSLYEQLMKQRHELQRISFTYWKPYIRNARETEFFQKNKNKIYNVFKGSLPILDKMLEEQGKDLADEWFEINHSNRTTHLFGSAVMGRSVQNIEVPYTSYQHTENLHVVITNLFRLAENVTRSLLGEKRELKIDESVLPEGLKQRIMEAVAVDSSSRKNARFVKVQSGSKTEGGSPIPVQPVTENVPLPASQFILDLAAIEEAKKGNEEFGILYNEYYGGDEGFEEMAVAIDIPSPNCAETEANSRALDILFEPASADNEAFMNDLREIEIQLLLAFDSLTQLVTDINRFAKAKGMSANVLITGINEKAIEHLGDNLIEQDGDVYVVVDEYIALLKQVKETHLK
jgi:hypothetical protein